MRQLKLWMFAAILTYGSLLTSCTSEDIPIEPSPEDLGRDARL